MTITYQNVLDDLESGEIYTGISSTAKKAWFKYCYHFSHVENIVSILEDGQLLSRSEAIRTEKMVSDNASRKIIEQTNPTFQDYVRLYFRPKSPTQFHNEGFKTVHQLESSGLEAQCPVPVFLFFDIHKILNHPDSRFSEKSLASSGEVSLYSTPEEFSALPFDKIYHDRGLSPEEKREIVGHRHAEIVLPHDLPIDEYLQKIVVRTPAEKETLLSLMDNRLKKTYGHLIQIDSTNNVFFSRWVHIFRVSLFQSGFNLELRSSEGRMQFDLEFEFQDNTGQRQRHTLSNWNANANTSFNFQSPYDEYELTIRFDGHLMYKGQYKLEENTPF